MNQFFLAGDFRFFWPENILNFATIPYSWDPILNTGLGKVALGSLWINSYLNFTAFFSKFGLSWNFISLIFWIIPPIILSFLSAFLLFRKIFPERSGFEYLAGLIYLLNTYLLMILTGGQLGVAIAYSLSPLVLFFALRSFEKSNFQNSVFLGLVVSLQVLFDPRIVYITLVMIFLFWLFNLFTAEKSFWKKIFKDAILESFIVSLIVFLLHSYWILPIIFYRQNPINELGVFYNTIGAVKFLSFANLENSISLLHPNFPENIFGKTYFLRAEFLILPILAFATLLFVDKFPKEKKKYLLFFVSLGLIGAFLGKGSNDPLGAIYLWLFDNFPGFVMFRDSTKWYMLTSASFSILVPLFLSEAIPVRLAKIANIKISEKDLKLLVIVISVFYLIFLIRPLIFGPNSLASKVYSVPKDYEVLKNFINKKPEFFRTVWIPRFQRFGFFSYDHPAMGIDEIEKDEKSQLTILRQDEKIELLSDLSVKYVIVPYDSVGEIFLEDRKYDETKRGKLLGELNEIEDLTKLSGFGKIDVFEIRNSKDHFFSPSKNLTINYKRINPTKYEVSVENAKKGDLLVFSEKFNPGWALASKNYVYETTPYKNLINSFVLNDATEKDYILYFKPQKLVQTGLIISLLTLTVTALSLIFLKKTK